MNDITTNAVESYKLGFDQGVAKGRADAFKEVIMHLYGKGLTKAANEVFGFMTEVLAQKDKTNE